MADNWIKMRISIRQHPKVVAMARHLAADRNFMDWWSEPQRVTCRDTVTEIVTFANVTRVTVVGLLEVWGSLNSVIKEDGEMNYMRLIDLDDISGLPGFGDAMASVGWVFEQDSDSGQGLVFPNFYEFNTPDSERKKAKSQAQRAKEYRERKKAEAEKNPRHETSRNVTENHAPSRGEEKRREEKNINTKTIPSESSEGVPDENPPDDSPPEKPKPSKLKFNDEHYQLAVELSCPSKARFGNALKIKLDEWADAIRRLNELDGHSLPEIAGLWRWIVNDDTQRGSFAGWALNCRTPMKLRQRKDGMQYFDIIQNQMTREVPHAGNQSHSGAGNDRPARRPSLVERMQQGAEDRVRGGRDSPDCRDVDGETVAENGFPLRA